MRLEKLPGWSLDSCHRQSKDKYLCQIHLIIRRRLLIQEFLRRQSSQVFKKRKDEKERIKKEVKIVQGERKGSCLLGLGRARVAPS
jgi:hypothetical protein